MKYKIGQIPWNKGIPRTTKEKLKMSESHKGKHYSKDTEFKKGIIPWNKDKTNIYSKKTIKNMSDSHKGQIAWNKGKMLPKEICRKISESKMGSIPWNKGIPRTEEEKEKIREANKNKHYSPKTEFKKGDIRLSGRNNSKWKGGITPENKKARSSLEMDIWRKEVFERDNYTCQKCGVRGGKLHAHHIENFSSAINLRFVTENGVTLHKEHHKEFHDIYGRRNNTQEQFNNFLKVVHD